MHIYVAMFVSEMQNHIHINGYVAFFWGGGVILVSLLECHVIKVSLFRYFKFQMRISAFVHMCGKYHYTT